jgi:hypothetical protein
LKYLVICILVLMTATAIADMPYPVDPVWQSTETGKNSTGLFWHDLDLDGYLDLFISNGNDITESPTYVYHNNAGAIPTTHTWQSSLVDYSGHCAVGDIDHDGYPEMFVSNYIADGWGPTYSRMYKNNSGTLTSMPTWTSGDTFHSFACDLGDIDGDGDLDIAFTCGEGYGQVAEYLRIYYNVNGQIDNDSVWMSAQQTYMLDVAWADVDLDGDLDLAFCGDWPHVWLFYNENGVLETTPSWESSDVSQSNTLAWGDVDGDGYLDLAVADNDQTGGQGKFKLYKNTNGTLGTLPVWLSATGGYGSAVCWYDFDRDGDLDLATGRWWDAVTIYENVGGTLTTSPVWTSNTSTVIEEIRVCDVDRDGVENYRDVSYENLKVQYVTHYPMQWLDSVRVNGDVLPLSAYCFDLNSGWVSLASAPSDSVEYFYQYSDKQDIGVSNWDDHNLIFADTLTHENAMPPRGDVNGDFIVNISDAVFLISYIFGGGPAPDPLEFGDVDCNGIVNISDAVYLINYIFGGGPAPCDWE